MSRADPRPSRDDGAQFIDASRKSLNYVLCELFHPKMMCADPGGSCTRIADTVRFISRNLEREERLMETGYPGYAAHKRAHGILLRKLDRMKRDFVCGAYDNALVAESLTRWTRSHNAAFDRPLADFLRERGTESVRRVGF